MILLSLFLVIVVVASGHRTDNTFKADNVYLVPPPGYVEQDSSYASENIDTSANGKVVCVASKFVQPHGATIVYRRGKFDAQLEPEHPTQEAGICAVSADGSTVIQGAPKDAGFVTVWTGRKWRVRRTIFANSTIGLGSRIAVSADGSVVVAAEVGFRVWVSSSGNTAAEMISVPAASTITSVDITADGKSLIVSGPNGIWSFDETVPGTWTESSPSPTLFISPGMTSMNGAGTLMATADISRKSHVTFYTRPTPQDPWQVALRLIANCIDIRTVAVSGGVVLVTCFNKNTAWLYKQRRDGSVEYDTQAILPDGLATKVGGAISANGRRIFLAVYDIVDYSVGYVVPMSR